MLHAAAHAHLRAAPEAVPGKADRSEDAVGGWLDAICDAGPRLGSSDPLAVNLRLRWAGAGLTARLFAHDEAAIDSIQHGVDRNCATGVSRSGAAGNPPANAGLCDQLASLAVSNRAAGHRKDCCCRAHQ